MHCDTMAFNIKQHYIESSSFDVHTHNAAAKILLTLQLTEEFSTFLAQKYFFIPQDFELKKFGCTSFTAAQFTDFIHLLLLFLKGKAR